MHWHFLLNVAVALVLGIAIGLERQWRQHQAGLRTNALVAVGAAMFVSLSQSDGRSKQPYANRVLHRQRLGLPGRRRHLCATG